MISQTFPEFIFKKKRERSLSEASEIRWWSTRSSTVLVSRASLLSLVLYNVVLLISCAKMPILLTILPTTPNVTRWSEVRWRIVSRGSTLDWDKLHFRSEDLFELHARRERKTRQKDVTITRTNHKRITKRTDKRITILFANSRNRDQRSLGYIVNRFYLLRWFCRYHT